MRFIIVCLCVCFMFIFESIAKDDSSLEKVKDEKIRSVLAQAKLRMNRSLVHNEFMFNLVELLLDVVNDMRTDVKKLKLEKGNGGNGGIGFTATTVGTSQLVSAGKPIPFSRMISDYGGSFKIVNGEFVCQKDGIYLFTASVCIETSDVWVYIKMNNKNIGYMYKDFDNNWGPGSGSTIVRMKKGDKLYLAPHKNSKFYEKVTIISAFRISN